MSKGAKLNGGAGANPYDKRPKKVGRPVKITEEHIETAEKLIGEGAFLAMLPGLMGIATSTFYEWSKRGAREVERRKHFEEQLEGLKDAEAKAEAVKLHKELLKSEDLFHEFSERLSSALQKRDLLLVGIIRKAAFGTQKITRKVKKELATIAKGTPAEPILNTELVVTEETETRTVEYDWRAAQYLVEKGQPAIFGPRVSVDVRKVLPKDPSAFADMDLPELLDMAKQVESAINGWAENPEI